LVGKKKLHRGPEVGDLWLHLTKKKRRVQIKVPKNHIEIKGKMKRD